MRVIVVEDQVLLREGMARLFEDAGHEVVAARGDANGLAAAVAGHQPDLVVLDIRMPPTFTDEGARAAHEVKTASPQTSVLILSGHVETAHLEALAPLGGFGYLLKDRVLDVDDFLGAAERVAQGGSALDPKVVAALIARGKPDGRLAALSEREREVLDLLAQGLSNVAIARALHLSERTVETHVRQLMLKLDIPRGDDVHRRVLATLVLLGDSSS
jgi:DNA-binding NarL/FixJ family response regulator